MIMIDRSKITKEKYEVYDKIEKLCGTADEMYQQGFRDGAEKCKQSHKEGFEAGMATAWKVAQKILNMSDRELVDHCFEVRIGDKDRQHNGIRTILCCSASEALVNLQSGTEDKKSDDRYIKSNIPNNKCKCEKRKENNRPHWIKDNGNIVCSECKTWFPEERKEFFKRCPYCGAGMEEGMNNIEVGDEVRHAWGLGILGKVLMVKDEWVLVMYANRATCEPLLGLWKKDTVLKTGKNYEDISNAFRKLNGLEGTYEGLQ
jgi:hypothetical protein